MVTIETVGVSKNRNKIWKCKCECGNYINVPTGSLVTGNTKSCGCLQKETNKIRGQEQRLLNRYEMIDDYFIGYTDKNEEFYFDIEDYDKIKNFTWRINENGYVVTQANGRIIRQHMLIMGSDGSLDIDHINHKTNDNRKYNLRMCQHYQNITSSKEYKNNTSGRKGVYWDKSRNKWMACITYNKQTYHLGRYNSFIDAVLAREIAEQKIHKEYHYEE